MRLGDRARALGVQAGGAPVHPLAPRGELGRVQAGTLWVATRGSPRTEESYSARIARCSSVLKVGRWLGLSRSYGGPRALFKTGIGSQDCLT